MTQNIRYVLFRELVGEIPSTTYATHGLYMYPAKFIPQVVRYVIKKYTQPGDMLFDPFAGYGTLAIEASLTNRNCVLWDLNPILHLLVRASLYTEPLTLRDLEVDFEYSETFYPRWNNIGYWHPPEFLRVLTRVWGYWHRALDDKLKPVVAIPLLKITRYFSYSDEKIAKLYKSKYAEEKVKKLLSTDWKSKMQKMYWDYTRETLEKIREYQRLKPYKINCVVKASDWGVFTSEKRIVDSINEKLDREVHVLVTSPPYLQAQEYIRSFKLELAWLGYPDDFITQLSKHEIPYNEIGEGEISSRTYEELKKEVARLNHDKLLELYTVYFNSLARFLNNNHEKVASIIAFFVGPAKIRNIRVPIDTIIREHLEYLGWKHEETLVDTIVARRLFKTQVNPATGIVDDRIPTEHLLIMRRRI